MYALSHDNVKNSFWRKIIPSLFHYIISLQILHAIMFMKQLLKYHSKQFAFHMYSI